MNHPEKNGWARWTRRHLALVSRLAPPKQFGRRIRWVFLIFALFNVAQAFIHILRAGADSVVPRPISLAAVCWLGWWWVHEYRRACYRAWTVPVEATVILLIGLAAHALPVTCGAVTISGFNPPESVTWP